VKVERLRAPCLDELAQPGHAVIIAGRRERARRPSPLVAQATGPGKAGGPWRSNPRSKPRKRKPNP
jgi:hypothetical protein